MFRFFLDKTEVEQPESFTNISFEKKRDEKYFGFILRRKGIVKVIGAGQIKFVEPKAFALLNAAKLQYGYGAEVPILITYYDEIAYSGTINFWNAEWYSESVVVTLSDDSTALKFITNANTKYSISCDSSQVLSSTGIVGKTTHQINESLYIYRSKVKFPRDFSHVVPFQNVSGSSKSNVNSLPKFTDIQPIYVNGSEKRTVSVKASIFVKAKATGVPNFQLLVNSLVIDQRGLTATDQDFVFVIDKNIVLQAYESVTVKIFGIDNSDDVTFEYDYEKSVLSIYEIKNDVIDTSVPCISSYNLVSSLVSKASENGFMLESSFLKTLKHDWTNGKNLRGVSSVVNVSFNDIFEELNKQYCLRCDVSESKVKIELRKNIIADSSKTYLNRDFINSEVEYPNRDMLYSKINVGYKNWSLDSALANQEVNSTMEFATNMFGRENTLNLECNSIASGILIEEIRQLQFGKVSNDQQKKFDEHLVSLIPYDGISKYKTSGLNADLKNLSVRPYQMLLNWAGVVGGYKSWVFVSGLGNYIAEISSKKQSATIATFGNIISDSRFEIEYTCDLWEYTNVGEVIYWTDTQGNDKVGVLMEAQWSTDKTMVLSIIELKNNSQK